MTRRSFDSHWAHMEISFWPFGSGAAIKCETELLFGTCVCLPRFLRTIKKIITQFLSNSPSTVEAKIEILSAFFLLRSTSMGKLLFSLVAFSFFFFHSKALKLLLSICDFHFVFLHLPPPPFPPRSLINFPLNGGSRARSQKWRTCSESCKS
jgi:hypothetical protein